MVSVGRSRNATDARSAAVVLGDRRIVGGSAGGSARQSRRWPGGGGVRCVSSSYARTTIFGAPVKASQLPHTSPHRATPTTRSCRQLAHAVPGDGRATTSTSTPCSALQRTRPTPIYAQPKARGAQMASRQGERRRRSGRGGGPLKAINHAFSTLSDLDRRSITTRWRRRRRCSKTRGDGARFLGGDHARDAPCAKRRIRKERRFVRKAAAFGVWVVALTAAVNALGAESPLFFRRCSKLRIATPARLRSRAASAISRSGPHGRAPRRPAARARRVGAHAHASCGSRSTHRSPTCKPPTSTRPKAARGSRRASARAPSSWRRSCTARSAAAAELRPPRDGVICAALLKPYTASKETWHDELKAAVERDSRAAGCAACARAADASECRASVGLSPSPASRCRGAGGVGDAGGV